MNEDILVSICCITYNQKEYIKDALDSFLIQKTNFKYEIIIHDDASNDGTTEIIKEYSEKYPDIIKPIYEEENQYSLEKWSLMKTFNQAKGKYIAVCEGDDYWINENKLQIQFDYMEENERCTFCFTNAIVKDIAKNKEYKFIPHSIKSKKYLKENNIYDVKELELLEFIPTASIMFRTIHVKDIPNWFEECFVLDWPLRLNMTSFGYAYYIDKELCLYRKNAHGSITVKNSKKEKKSIEWKKHVLEEQIKLMSLINEFTEGKHGEIFEFKKNQYEIEYLLLKKQYKKILEMEIFKKLDKKQKFKYLIRMVCPNLVNLCIKIKIIGSEKWKTNQKIK